jgi:hypothetical protein
MTHASIQGFRIGVKDFDVQACTRKHHRPGATNQASAYYANFGGVS